MSTETDTLTDFDKQLIAVMEEIVAHVNGEPSYALALLEAGTAGQVHIDENASRRARTRGREERFALAEARDLETPAA